MPLATTRISDFNELQVSFAAIPIEGWADGDALIITKEADAFTDYAGNTGHVARAKTNDYRATVEIRLMQTSPTNAAFSAIYKADREAPGGAGVAEFHCVDLNGTSIYFAGNAWILRSPDPTFSRTPTERSWMIRCAQLFDFTGGNL